MTPADRLAEIRARAAAATPGPWEADDCGSRIQVCEVRVGTLVCEIDTSYDADFKRDLCEADAALIANAREDIPWLLDALADAQKATRIEHDAVTAKAIHWRKERTALLAEIERLRALVSDHHSVGALDSILVGDDCPVCVAALACGGEAA